MDRDRRRSAHILVLVGPALLLGVVMGTQAQTASRLPLTATRYNVPLLEAATQLQREQAILKSEIVALRGKLDDTLRQQSAIGGAAAALQAEIDRLNHVVGLTPRSGPGVVITLDDARLPANAPTRVIEAGIIHSGDITDVLNAAWKAGAEAVSVNGERITGSSACVGAVIQINGSLLSPPFVFNVLGPRDQLYGVLNNPRELSDLKRRRDAFGTSITIERADTLQVPAFSGPMQIRYAKPTNQP
jgi:uncharacterized protein YlxW (UPF0749 family)